MKLFEFLLLLLFAIFISNIINRFFPWVSVTILQIILGALIALLPLRFHLTLDPELFFVLFIAPLIFDNSVHIDKDAFWKLKLPIISLAFGLLFVSTIIGGFLVNVFIPAIPAAAGCALIASLGPTDDVAVFSLAKRTKLPNKLMNILLGESAINDAAGIVGFQFSIGVIMTGVFSPVYAVMDLVWVSIGGIAVGLILTAFKYLLMRWIRSLGLENVTLHILMEILTPFLVFLAADALGLSGVLAAFAAGVVHSFARDQLTPDNIKLRSASESVWDMLSFTLNGLVFLLMGTQLPAIIEMIGNGDISVSVPQIVFYVAFIMLFLLVMRFIWSLFIHKKTYTEANMKIGKIKAGIIVSLSGARGAVTLASILSIPLLLGNGTIFPQRDLLVLISASVILISLILSDFVLPLLLGQGKSMSSAGKLMEENKAYIEVLQTVAAALQAQVTPENIHAVQIVRRDYLRRIYNLKHRRHPANDELKEEHEMKLKTFAWEKENTMALLEQGEITKQMAHSYLNQMKNNTTRENWMRMGIINTSIAFFGGLRRFIRSNINPDRSQRIREMYHKLKISNDRYVLEKLKILNSAGDNPEVKKAISNYEVSLSFDETLNNSTGAPIAASGFNGSNEGMNDIMAQAFQMERDGIYNMFEQGRISRESAREMRNNIAVLEMELTKE